METLEFISRRNWTKEHKAKVLNDDPLVPNFRPAVSANEAQLFCLLEGFQKVALHSSFLRRGNGISSVFGERLFFSTEKKDCVCFVRGHV